MGEVETHSLSGRPRSPRVAGASPHGRVRVAVSLAALVALTAVAAGFSLAVAVRSARGSAFGEAV